MAPGHIIKLMKKLEQDKQAEQKEEDKLEEPVVDPKQNRLKMLKNRESQILQSVSHFLFFCFANILQNFMFENF